VATGLDGPAQRDVGPDADMGATQDYLILQPVSPGFTLTQVSRRVLASLDIITSFMGVPRIRENYSDTLLTARGSRLGPPPGRADPFARGSAPCLAPRGAGAGCPPETPGSTKGQPRKSSTPGAPGRIGRG